MGRNCDVSNGKNYYVLYSLQPFFIKKFSGKKTPLELKKLVEWVPRNLTDHYNQNRTQVILPIDTIWLI